MLAACQSNGALLMLNAITPNTGYTLEADVSFGSETRQRLDIYQPDMPADDARLVVFVYGGAWRQGVKGDYAFLAQALAEQGHWVVVPDYRLYPDAVFPQFVQDVQQAVIALPEILANSELQYPPAVRLAKLASDQSDAKLDIVLMGHSSGAHSAALLASDATWFSDSTVNVTSLIAMSGPYDLPLDNAEVRDVFRNALDGDDALPLASVSSQHPPTLLIHGTKDRRVLPLHTERYASALRNYDVPHEVFWIDGSGHAAPLTGMSLRLPDNGVLGEVMRFLKR